MNQKKGAVEELRELIDQAHSPYHCVAYLIERLKENGFEELSLTRPFVVKPGGKYYVNAYGSTCFALTVGKQAGKEKEEKEEADSPIPFRLITAHTDWPTFMIKPKPELTKSGYGRLNVEPYGGAIYTSWLDRPLGIAGKVCIKGRNAFHPEVRLFDSGKALAVIPGLAIHMEREMNDGMKLNPQLHLLPLVSLKESGKDEERFFLAYLASKLGVLEQDLLDYELFLYNTDQSALTGLSDEMLSAPRIDNYSSVQAALHSILQADQSENQICISAFYHNEEIGSMTKQGADSGLTQDLIERVFMALGYSLEESRCALLGGLCLSLDVAHATHPGFLEKSDPTNEITMGDGLAIKLAARQSYATDSSDISVIQSLCEEKHIAYTKYVNRSDQRGGSTLGSITSAKLSIPTVDAGIPLLAMHSARELMAVEDQEALSKLADAFYQG